MNPAISNMQAAFRGNGSAGALNRTQAFRSLRNDGVCGVVPRGLRLLTERVPARCHGVSNPATREAIRDLSLRGLGNVRHGSGACVTADVSPLLSFQCLARSGPATPDARPGVARTVLLDDDARWNDDARRPGMMPRQRSMAGDHMAANPASEPGLSRNEVEQAEARRQAAMLAENVPSLSELLADDLVWIHGSSKRDTKASFLDGFASGRFRCFRLAHAEVSIRTFGPAALVTGTLEMHVAVDGERRTVNNLYGALWVRHPDGPKLVHWQSTRA